MKKVLVCLLFAAFLVGCGAEPTYETISAPIPVEPVAAQQQFFVSLPQEAATPTFEDGNGAELYICQGYTISKQIWESGDLEKSIQTLTGQSQDDLQVIKTRQGSADRYDFVWTTAGEDGLQLGRACILDDGNYHYSLTALAEEAGSGELQEVFQDMFDSCVLLDPEVNLRTGS